MVVLRVKTDLYGPVFEKAFEVDSKKDAIQKAFDLVIQESHTDSPKKRNEILNEIKNSLSYRDPYGEFAVLIGDVQK